MNGPQSTVYFQLRTPTGMSAGVLILLIRRSLSLLNPWNSELALRLTSIGVGFETVRVAFQTKAVLKVTRATQVVAVLLP